MAGNRVHLWNSLLCPPLGFGLNLLLLWLIHRRTPKEMTVHSRVLLQTCLLDCLVLAVETVVVVDRDGNSVCFFEGYFIMIFGGDILQPPLLFALSLLWFIFTNISLLGIGVQFVNRYLVLNRNMSVSLRQYLLFLAVPTVGVCAISYVFNMDYLKTTVAPSSINIEYFASVIELAQGRRPLFIASATNNCEDVLLLSMYAVSYCVILCCGWMMVRFVRNHATFNARLKQLNRQLTRTLIILIQLKFVMAVTAFYEAVINVSARLEMLELSQLFLPGLPVELLPTYIFEKKFFKEAEESCPICKESFEEEQTIVHLQCGHLFHVACLSSWLKQSTRCPVCQKEVMEYVKHIDGLELDYL